jgi:hypothetical protein
MNALQIRIRIAVTLGLVTGASAASVPAQEAGSAGVDSLATDPGDTLVAAVDSLAVSPVDSLARMEADSTGVTSEEAGAPETAPWFASWQPASPAVDRSILEWTRPEDFDRAIDWLPGSSVRVAGETGMAAFVNTGPFGSSPELLIDAVPSRSPGDLDPAIWDRASTSVVGIGSTEQDADRNWGGSAINATLVDPLAGRTVLHTYFTSAKYDTYTRAVGLRTTGTTRLLSFDFQEFKTETGYDYSLAPDVIADPSNRGRSKQRHFRIGGKAKTGLGELGFEFGRGRRYARGDVMSAQPLERWTGQLSLSLDRDGDTASWHTRLYHLDFRDDWFSDFGQSEQSTDAARQGLRFERVVKDGGFYGGLTAEHQSARFNPADADTNYVDTFVGRAGVGWRASDESDWTPWISLQAVGAEHTPSPVEFGGRAGLRRQLGPMTAEIQAERIPRTPTLAESYGVFFRRLVTPTTDGSIYDPLRAVWVFNGAPDLEFELQDRAGFTLAGEWGRLGVSATYSVWRLERGIGWIPDDSVPDPSPGQPRLARTVGDLESTLDMIEATLRYSRRFGTIRMRLLGRGHYMPGGIELVGSRPGGWPRAAVLGRVGFDRHFFSPRNHIGVDLDVDFMGEHFDDLTAAIGGVVPGTMTLDARAWLAIRDAEIFFAIDNFLDENRIEVLGTTRRYSQFRFGLTWNFYN